MSDQEHPLSSPRKKIRPLKGRPFVRCPECDKETFHDLIHTIRREWNGPFIEEQDRHHLYELIQCNGCDAVSLIHRVGSREAGSWDVEYYPSPASRRVPDWIEELKSLPIGKQRGENIAAILTEIYCAVGTRSYRLAAVGVRCLLEHIMIDKVGDNGSFGRNLNIMYEKDIFSLSQRDTLHAVLEVGHAAAHRFFEPSEAQIATMLDITESILASVYIHPERAIRITDRVPTRRPPRSD